MTGLHSFNFPSSKTARPTQHQVQISTPSRRRNRYPATKYESRLAPHTSESSRLYIPYRMWGTPRTDWCIAHCPSRGPGIQTDWLHRARSGRYGRCCSDNHNLLCRFSRAHCMDCRTGCRPGQRFGSPQLWRLWWSYPSFR